MRQLIVLAVMGLFAGRAAAATASLRVRADADTEFEARVLLDRATVGLWTQGIAVNDLRAGVAAFSDARANLDLVAVSDGRKGANSAGESIVYLTFDAPMHQATADWAGGYWTIKFEAEDVQAALATRVATTKLVLPGGVDTSPMRHAEGQLAGHNIAAAKAAYTELLDTYALAAWATLRLGDVALMENDIDGACALWLNVDAVSPGRVAGTLAGLRARSLRCPQATMPDWYALLMRRGRDDLVGQRLRDDTRWALQWETDGPALEGALAAGEAALTTPLFQQVWARLFRSSVPMQVVRLGARPDVPLGSHAEGIDLAFTIGRAWCALDVASQASTQVVRLPRKNWIALSPAGIRAMTHAVSACRLAGEAADGDAAEARALGQLADPTATLLGRLKQFDTRLDTVERVLGKELVIAEETP